MPILRARGALRFSAPEPAARARSPSTDFADPLVPTEWWRAAVGVDTLTPPPAGQAVTIVDSGIDVTHPEFLGRANTETLNAQEPAGIGGEHGTAVASLVAAPANGLGLVGIYPEARPPLVGRRQGAGHRARDDEIVQGILAAANSGPGVVNLSLGSDDKELVIEQAIYEAVRKGTLVVAASGNDGDTGNPLGYPASIPHVLTVGASDRDERGSRRSRAGRASSISPRRASTSRSRRRSARAGATGDGTSFAAPLVSGASAWVWTVRPELDATQLFEVMRRSAVDIGAPGRDDAAGFGLLNVPAALAYPAPVRDPFEPNDDIEFVRPGRSLRQLDPAADDADEADDDVQARLDRVEDPRDVYRVWLPEERPHHRHADGRRERRPEPLEAGHASASSSASSATTGSPGRRRPGRSERLTFANKGPGRFAFLAVVFPKDVPRGDVSPPRLVAALRPRGARPTTAAYSTGGSSTTSGLRTRTRTAVTGQLGDERIGDRGGEGLEQVIRRARPRPA